MGSSLIDGLAYRKNTNAKVERANGEIGDTLRAYANGRKDEWEKHTPFAKSAINTASTLGGKADMTPYFIDRGGAASGGPVHWPDEGWVVRWSESAGPQASRTWSTMVHSHLAGLSRLFSSSMLPLTALPGDGCCCLCPVGSL